MGPGAMTTPQSQTVSEVGAKYLRLHLANGVGPMMLGRLLERFSSVDRVLSATRNELCDVDGIGPARADAVRRAGDGQGVDDEIARAGEHGVRIVCREDAEYPALLWHMPDPPICLYVRGELRRADAIALAIVGTRRCSHYGSEQARRFASGLARLGFTIVSGLARGIDSWAHRGALEARGRTIAVLGNGLPSIYPPEHAALADQVAADGAVVTEFPMGMAPEAGHFPSRNRIISGLGLGVLVVEAGSTSGALITARLASEYNREVFAVPGRVDTDNAGGTNGMIRRGEAKLVANIQDVLDELGDVGRFLTQPEAGPSGQRDATASGVGVLRLEPDERKLVEVLGCEEVGLEELCLQSGLDAGRAMATLTGLQLKGLVRRLPGDRYVRRQAGG